MRLRRLRPGWRRCSGDGWEAQERSAGSERVFGTGVDAPSGAPSAAGEACAVAARERQRWTERFGGNISGVVGQRRLSAASALLAGTEAAGAAAAFPGDAA